MNEERNQIMQEVKRQREAEMKRHQTQRRSREKKRPSGNRWEGRGNEKREQKAEERATKRKQLSAPLSASFLPSLINPVVFWGKKTHVYITMKKKNKGNRGKVKQLKIKDGKRRTTNVRENTQNKKIMTKKVMYRF